MERADALPGGGEGFGNAGGVGAARNVMAVEGRLERYGCKEVSAEGWAESLELGQGDCVELAAGFEAKTDGVADDLMGLAEGNALVGEIGRGGHRVEVAGLGGGLHFLEAELEGAGEVGEDAEEAGEGVGYVEDLLLAFLQVFVVGEG